MTSAMKAEGVVFRHTGNDIVSGCGNITGEGRRGTVAYGYYFPVYAGRDNGAVSAADISVCGNYTYAIVPCLIHGPYKKGVYCAVACAD